MNECAACTLGVASQGPCRMTPGVRETGTILCAQGERPRTVMVIKDGFVCLSSVSTRGAELSLSLRGPGSLLCMEALRGAPSPHEVRALSRLKVCVLSGDGMGSWLGPEKSPARAVLDLVLNEGQLQRDDMHFRRGDCLTRVARFALAHASFLTERPGAVRKGMVARLLGMRPETLSRCLSRLQERGVIDANRGVRVIDPQGLAAMVLEDPLA